MPNLVITSDFETVFVAFNDEAANVGMTKASFRRADINIVYMPSTNTHVVVQMQGGQSFEITDDGSYAGALTVDTVDTVAPVDLDDLFDMIRALQL